MKKKAIRASAVLVLELLAIGCSDSDPRTNTHAGRASAVTPPVTVNVQLDDVPEASYVTSVAACSGVSDNPGARSLLILGTDGGVRDQSMLERVSNDAATLLAIYPQDVRLVVVGVRREGEVFDVLQEHEVAPEPVLACDQKNVFNPTKIQACMMSRKMREDWIGCKQVAKSAVLNAFESGASSRAPASGSRDLVELVAAIASAHPRHIDKTVFIASRFDDPRLSVPFPGELAGRVLLLDTRPHVDDEAGLLETARGLMGMGASVQRRIPGVPLQAQLESREEIDTALLSERDDPVGLPDSQPPLQLPGELSPGRHTVVVGTLERREQAEQELNRLAKAHPALGPELYLHPIGYKWEVRLSKGLDWQSAAKLQAAVRQSGVSPDAYIKEMALARGRSGG